MRSLETGNMKFGDQLGGLYLAGDDVKFYFAALHTVLAGRNDPASLAMIRELLELLREAHVLKNATEPYETQLMKPYEECLAVTKDAGQKAA